MRVLVTGGTGFLGRHLLPMLNKHEIFAISRSTSKKSGFSDKINWIEADLSQGFDEDILPKNIDAIIHLAQSDQYRDFPNGAGDVFKVNVEIPSKLLRWSQKTGVSQFISASTGTVYEPFTSKMDETVFTSPTGYYGASKLAFENLSLAYQDIFSVCQLRVFFLYGKGQEGMMIANLINAIKQGKTLTLPKDNDGLEFVPTHVEDTARIFVKALEENWTGIYNVASPHSVNFKQLLEQIGDSLGKQATIEKVDAKQPTPIIPDLKKLNEKVDTSSFLNLTQGLRKTV